MLALHAQMSDASSRGEAPTPIGHSPLLADKQNAFWSHREGDSSSSTFSSNMSCSIEGKPSMDSVLRPKQPPGSQAQGSRTASSRYWVASPPALS